MDISAIQKSWQGCEETAKARSKIDPDSRRVKLRAEAEQLIKEKVPNVTIQKRLGLASTTISRYKSEMTNNING